jgi:TetR/AcrR family transcriptional regulator, mexJK operon transcriptional repressor
MPPRDEQDYEQRRQQIIDGALAAFSAKGFDAASNKDIAEAAKIGSPGLIYHYFKDKVDLLHQVIVARMPLLRLLDDAQGMLDQPPEVVLPLLAERVMQVFEQPPTMALMRVVFAEAARNPRVAAMVSEIGPGRGLRMFATYLERQMATGRLRAMDPHVAARIFIGPLMAYAITREIFQQPESKAIPPEVMARSAAESFLRGMAPES